MRAHTRAHTDTHTPEKICAEVQRLLFANMWKVKGRREGVGRWRRVCRSMLGSSAILQKGTGALERKNCTRQSHKARKRKNWY